MDTELIVNDFTHEELLNDIKDLFCSVSDWHSRERGISRALSAQRCFCGVFLIHVWLKDRSCIRKLQQALIVEMLPASVVKTVVVQRCWIKRLMSFPFTFHIQKV